MKIRWRSQVFIAVGEGHWNATYIILMSLDRADRQGCFHLGKNQEVGITIETKCVTHLMQE